MRAGVSGFAGFEGCHGLHKGRLANIVIHLTVAGVYLGSMYKGLCAAYARANSLGSAPCLGESCYALLFTTSLVSRETLYAAGNASRQPPGSDASKMKLAMRTVQKAIELQGTQD